MTHKELIEGLRTIYKDYPTLSDQRHVLAWAIAKLSRYEIDREKEVLDEEQT